MDAFAQAVGIQSSTLAHMRQRQPSRHGPTPSVVANWAQVLGLDAENERTLLLVAQAMYAPEEAQRFLLEHLAP